MEEALLKLALDSEENRQKIQDLRNLFESMPGRILYVDVVDRNHALLRAMNIIQRVLRALQEEGIDFHKVEPGHGVGHMMRDYTNALRLLSWLDVSPAEVFVGFVAGALHDVGCALVSRYDEKNRIVRHAEVSALVLGYVFESFDEGYLSEEEGILIQYAVAAHTHYLRKMEVKDDAGEVIGEIEPYMDTFNGDPLYYIQIPRWIDRLDTNGPAHLGRHYFTLVKSHEEFDGNEHYQVDFAQAMRPLLRTKEERGTDSMTMAEHLRMYAESQSNDSPYGANDFGTMVTLRDEYKAQALKIVEATQLPALRVARQEEVLESWTAYLGLNNEPTDVGKQAAKQLENMFFTLPKSTQRAWITAFHVCLHEYAKWSREAAGFLYYVPKQFRMLPGVSDDLQHDLIF